MRLAAGAFAVVLAFGSVSAVAAEPPKQGASEQSDRPDRINHALMLAKIAQPQELVVGTALKQLDGGLIETMRGDPELKMIEDQYPGFLARYYAAARPELEKALRARLPLLWQAMAEAYANVMTRGEIDAYARFLEGPVGQKMQHLSTDNFDASALLQASVDSGTQTHAAPEAGKKELLAASSMAMLSTLALLSDAERSQFVDFMGSPAGKAGQRAGRGVTAAVVAWMNADDSKAEGKMAQIAISVLTTMKSEKEASR